MTKKHTSIRYLIFIFLIVQSSLISSQSAGPLSQKKCSEKEATKQEIANIKEGLIDLSMIHDKIEQIEGEADPIVLNTAKFAPIVMVRVAISGLGLPKEEGDASYVISKYSVGRKA